MSMMLWKTLALGGVIGVGSVVVVQAKRSLDQGSVAAGEQKSLDEQFPLFDEGTGLETSFSSADTKPPKKLPEPQAAEALATLNPVAPDENPFGGEPSQTQVSKASAELGEQADPFAGGGATESPGQSEPPSTLKLEEPSNDQLALLDPAASNAAPPQATESNPFEAARTAAAADPPPRSLRKLRNSNDGPVLIKPPTEEPSAVTHSDAPAVSDNPFAQFATSPKTTPQPAPAVEPAPTLFEPSSTELSAPPPKHSRETRSAEAPIDLPPATLNPEKSGLRNRRRETIPEQTEPEVASQQDAGLAAPRAPQLPEVSIEHAPGQARVSGIETQDPPVTPSPVESPEASPLNLTGGQFPGAGPGTVPAEATSIPKSVHPQAGGAPHAFDRTIPNEAPSSIPHRTGIGQPDSAGGAGVVGLAPSGGFNPDESPTAHPADPSPAAANPFPPASPAAPTSIPNHSAAPATTPFNQAPPVTAPPSQSKSAPAAQPDLTGTATIDGQVTIGPSQPQLTIIKQAPSEAVVGQDLEYSIQVKNVGRSAAHNVVVEDLIPKGSRCTGTIPKAESQVEKKNLIWKLGTLAAGAEQLIRVRITPTDAGEIGSVATVSFSAAVAAKTTIVEPKAMLTLAGPHEAVIGEPAQYKFTVTNNGPVDLKGVFVRTLLPQQGLSHPGGSDLEYEVGDLPRSRSREVALTMTPTQAGAWKIESTVTTGGRELSKASAELHVVGARLTVTRSGPTKRFVGRSATYSNTVTNNSGQNLSNVTVVETLPTGLDPAGQLAKDVRWDPSRRTLTWVIPQLAPGQAVDLPCTVMPKTAGDLRGQITARDASGNRAEIATALEVAGFSSLVVDGGHDGRPVAIGDQVSFRFSVKNKGTAPAEQVVAMFDLPSEVEFVSAQGPGNLKFQRDGRVVLFDAMPIVPVNGELNYDVVVQAKSATPQNGDQRVQVKLYSTQLPSDRPLEQEQQLVIYGDDDGPQPVQRVSGKR